MIKRIETIKDFEDLLGKPVGGDGWRILAGLVHTDAEGARWVSDKGQTYHLVRMHQDGNGATLVHWIDDELIANDGTAIRHFPGKGWYQAFVQHNEDWPHRADAPTVKCVDITHALNCAIRLATVQHPGK